MSEFKGTKGEWSVNINDTGHITSVRSIEAGRTIFTSKVNNMIESNANMNLAMHSRELLDKLIYVTDLINLMSRELTDEGKNKIKEVEKLIKKATE